VRHSSYGALIRGYEITIPEDAVCAFEGVSEQDALDYLQATYGARLTSVSELVGTPVTAA
jgi:nicotinamidase-related amidase